MGNKILNEILEYLRTFYKFPAIFSVERCCVEILSKGSKWWYIDDVPVKPIFALMFEGVKNIIDEQVELRLIEVALRHLRSEKVLFSFLDDPRIIHLYEAVPKGGTIKIYAKIVNGDVVFTDISQLKQFIDTRISLRRYCTATQ